MYAIFIRHYRVSLARSIGSLVLAIAKRATEKTLPFAGEAVGIGLGLFGVLRIVAKS